MCDKNAKRYRGGGYGGPNSFTHAADFFVWCINFFSQQSFQKDVEPSSSASILITDDKQFLVLALFNMWLMKAFQIEPIQLVAVKVDHRPRENEVNYVHHIMRKQ